MPENPEPIEKLACCLGRRRIYAFSWIGTMTAGFAALAASISDDPTDSHRAMDMLVSAGATMFLWGLIVLNMLRKEESRRWLIQADPELARRKVSTGLIWSVRLVPPLLLMTALLNSCNR
jgi:hypothetical protein